VTTLPPPQPNVDAPDHGGTTNPMVPRAPNGPSGSEGLFGISFSGLARAQEFLLALGGLSQAGHLVMRDAVVVVKDLEGKVRVAETIDPQPGRSALSGATWVGLLGLIFGGPVGWIAGLGLGAGIGALTAKLVDLGIPDAWVAWFKDEVGPGTATVVALASDIDLGALSTEVARFAGAKLVHTTMTTAAATLLAGALVGSAAKSDQPMPWH
jgi:uncharacterized membrane protein